MRIIRHASSRSARTADPGKPGRLGVGLAIGLGLVAGAAAATAKSPKVKQPAAASQPAAAPTADFALVAEQQSNPLGIDASVLDRTVRPCDDFFRYACGGWLQRTEIPADRPSWSRGFSEIQERNQKLMRKLLEEAGHSPAASPTDRKLGDFFASCMAEDRIEKSAAADLAAQLKPVDGIKSLDDLAREVARQHLALGSPLFQLSSQQDFKDAKQVIAGLDQGGLGLPDRDYYLKTDSKSDELRKDYLGHVEKMLTLAGVPAAAAKGQAATIFQIEKQLAQSSMSRVDRRDPKKLYHRLELDGVLKLAPHFPWQTYLTSLGFGGLREINVLAPDFFSGLDKLLAEQPLDSLKLYLRWQLLRAAAPLLSKAFVDENFHFYSQRLTGTAQILPRWKRCVAATDRALGEALGAAFVRQTFGADGKRQTQEIINAIEQAMEENLKGLSWMDEPTRAAALGKLKRIANKIGYPDKQRDYAAVSVTADSYLKSSVSAAIFESRRDLGKIGRPLDRSEWEMTAPTVNAYYEPALNEIVFPAGILQPPMFGRGLPRAVNYGAIGVVMGHEVTHGFDDEGRQFDASGNLSDWWSPKVSSEFDHRTSCVVDQYNGYSPLEGQHLDGKLTLGENIADLGGVKLAHRAYQAVAKRLPAALPKSSEFSDAQLFFLGFAQSWCAKQRPEFARMLLTVDPHSPAEFRVNGPLSNLEEFAAAWQCKAGDKMVRQNLCAVW